MVLILSGCSRDDFDLSKIASTTIAGFGEKLGNLSLSGIGEQIGIQSEPLVKLSPAPLPVYAVGDTFVYSSGGTLVQEQVVSANEDRVTWTNDQGITFEKEIALDDKYLFSIKQSVINPTDKKYDFYFSYGW